MCSMIFNMYIIVSDSEVRTAGSDKHNQPQQYSAYWGVAHARRVGGGVDGICACVCCLPSVCLGSYESLGETDNILPVRTYKNKASRTETREIVLSTRAEKQYLSARHAPQKARIAPRPQTRRPDWFLRQNLSEDRGILDLRYTPKPTYLTIFTNNIWSYLLWSSEIDMVGNRRKISKYNTLIHVERCLTWQARRRAVSKKHPTPRT